MAAERAFCPYVGLQPFTEADRPYFFGREREIRLVGANLLAAKLTVLYGESGVGKSSLLMAGVVPQLRSKPRTAVVVFRDWQRPDAPAQVRRAVAEATVEAGGATQALDESAPLDDLLAAAGRAVGGTVLVLLDQFEEYFVYYPPGGAGDAFDAELARAVNRRDVNAGFLLSLREDSLSRLDRFRARIPTVLANPLRIRHLRPQDARAAIEKPLAVYNARPDAAGAALSIEPALVDALIEQTVSGRVSLAGRRNAGAANDVEERVEAPYLQLVLTRLWEEEARAGSAALRLATLARLGGAARIVRTHLDQVMSKLPSADQSLCARFFDRMVTPSGTKIACRLDDLKQWAPGVHEREVERVLGALAGADARILRAIDSLPGQPRQYEIFHDVLAAGVLDWQRRFQERRRRLWRIGIAAGVLFGVIAIAAWMVVDAERERNLAVERQKTAQALAALEEARAREANERAAAEKAAAAAEEARRLRAEREAALAQAMARPQQGPQQPLPQAVPPSALPPPSAGSPPPPQQQVARPAPGQAVVFVQFADPGQQADAERARRELAAAGYFAPAAEQVRAAPPRNEVRYFRDDDADAARRLAETVLRWNVGPVEVRRVTGYEQRVRVRELELWLARRDDDALRALVQRINAATAEERKPAVAELTSRYATSPAAIGEVLGLFAPERIDALRADGRINALFFLTRTVPGAWTPELERQGRQAIALLRERDASGRARMGDATRAEVQRLENLLDQVRSGAKTVPLS